MKIGIAGAGSIVRELLSVSDKIKGVSFTHIFARRVEVRDEMSEKYSLCAVDSFDALLDADIDAVYIALPNNCHFEYAMRALDKGKSVILEKPFTRNLEECDALIEKANEMNLKLGINLEIK